MLKASLFENFVQLSELQMRNLVDSTFAEVDINNDGKISFEEYNQMVKKYPQIVEGLTISPIEIE